MAGLTALGIRALCRLFATAQDAGLAGNTSNTSKTSKTSNMDTPTFAFSTSSIARVVVGLAREEGANMSPGLLSAVPVGRALGKMRLSMGPRTAAPQRTWLVTGPDLARRAQSDGLPQPASLADSTLAAEEDEFELLSTRGKIT